MKISESGLHIVDNSAEENTQEEKLVDNEQECMFFLVYHLHIQPSEVKQMTREDKEFMIERFIYQKNMERQMMQEMRQGAVSPVSADFLRELERTRN